MIEKITGEGLKHFRCGIHDAIKVSSRGEHPDTKIKSLTCKGTVKKASAM